MNTLTILPATLAEDIKEYRKNLVELGEREENGENINDDQWEAFDNDARDLIWSVSDCLHGNSVEDYRINATSDTDSVRLTVEETTTYTLEVHPDRFPEGYDIDEDPDNLVEIAVADATAQSLGLVHVTDRTITRTI